jgi:single-stranded-DNA-specific exonuclease
MVCEAAERSAPAQGNRAVAVVAGEGWHPGVIGIVAGRLKEKLGRPRSSSRSARTASARAPAARSPASISARRCSPPRTAAADRRRRPRDGGGPHRRRGQDRRAWPTSWTSGSPRTSPAPRRPRAAARRGAGAGRRLPDLCDALDGGGPYGAGWPAPRVAAGPVRIVKADVVGNGHLRLIVAGDDGRRIKAIAFRMADSALGEAMLPRPAPQALDRRPHQARRLGRPPAAELHLEDAACRACRPTGRASASAPAPVALEQVLAQVREEQLGGHRLEGVRSK